MIRWTCAALLAIALAGCASGGDPAARNVGRAPSTWNAGEREAPRARAAPSPPEIPRGYPEADGGAPVYLLPDGRWTPVGRGSAERRRLTGRGASFMVGIAGPGASVPVRRAVWAEDAYTAAPVADTALFATPWIPAARLAGEIRCGAAPRTRARARLAGLFRVAGDDLLIEAWMETDGAPACQGERGARERVRAFADDLDRFAREAARRGVPVPLPGG